MAFSANAQKSAKTNDMIVLKNGDRLTGEIIKYDQGKEVSLKLEDGSVVTIKDDEIKNIIQEVGERVEDVPDAEFYEPAPKEYYPSKTKGFYNITQLSFAMGSGDAEGLALGAGISTIFGMQFQPILGVGFGVGLDNYARRGETIYPVFIDIRGYLPFFNKENSYYYTLNGGYGFAFPRKSIGINEAEGGILVHGAIGYRTTTKEGVDVNMDIGAKFQEASFSRDLFNGDVEVRNLVFQRLAVRVGIALWGKKN